MDNLIKAIYDKMTTKKSHTDSKNNQSAGYFDFTLVDEISTDETFRQRIIEDFVFLFGESIELLGNAIENESLSEVYHVLHKVTPNLQYLGINQLEDLSIALMQKINKNKISKWNKVEPELEALLHGLIEAHIELKRLGDSP